MNPHADRDRSEQPSDRTPTPDAGTTRVREARVERYAEALYASGGTETGEALEGAQGGEER